MNIDTKNKIESFIQQNSIALFMKGNKYQPECGFSAKVIDVLNQITSDYETFNILTDPNVREGIKEYSSWPTIPQLYINQEFIGGCDIVLDLYKSGELQKILGLKKATQEPNIQVSQEALTAFKNAQAQSNTSDPVRIKITAGFEHELEFDEKNSEDFVIEIDGIEIIIDPYSASKADGLSIGFIEDGLESGFDFHNPNVPNLVKDLEVQELNSWQENNKPFLLIDVRPKSEWDKAHINFAKRLEEFSKSDLEKLSRDQAIIFHCHHGGRSQRMAEKWRLNGFTNVYNLIGGIDAWAKKIDKNVGSY